MPLPSFMQSYALPKAALVPSNVVLAVQYAYSKAAVLLVQSTYIREKCVHHGVLIMM